MTPIRNRVRALLFACSLVACSASVGAVDEPDAEVRCESARFTFDTTPAEVLFVVDRSSSMTTMTEDHVSRWDALTAAMREVLPGLDARLPMGLVTFPEAGDCSVSANPAVPVRASAGGQIATRLAMRAPYGYTPTLAAIRQAARYFEQNPSARRRVIVLATDGPPNCGNTMTDVVNALTDIRMTLHVDTLILGIPGENVALRRTLHDMAVAGGRPRAGGLGFYEAGQTAEFVAALRAITADAMRCEYRLPSAPRATDRVTVRVDSVEITRGSHLGWDFIDDTRQEIRLGSEACARLTRGEVRSIDVRFTCD